MAMTPPNAAMMGLMETAGSSRAKRPSNAGKVTDRLAALHDAAGYVFAQNAGRDRCQDNNRRAEAENDDGRNHRPGQRQMTSSIKVWVVSFD